ncbi:Heparanase [Dissostichus eleginoides]|uniref:Heparanase n=1 Tax=Dissostichus eleginoides TaxID=100907 RepID=A0AAD9BKQ1_DISEL|nr:Heparanase [Dissostichus eleginoides]
MESVQLLVLVLMWNRSSGSLFQNQTKTRFSPFLPPNLTRFSHPVLPVLLHVSSVFRRVERRFLSVTIDSSLASEEKFMSLLSSPKVRTLAKALSPAFLLFGERDKTSWSSARSAGALLPLQSVPTLRASGEKSSSARLLPSWLEQRLKKEWSRQQILLKKEDLHRKYKRVKFTEYTVDLLHSFSNCSGLDLIFGLNALLRTSENIWNGSNARSLLQYCESRGYQMDWELGNEPNSYEKKAGVRVDGFQLGKDFAHLREMMSQSKLYRHAGLYGPDVGQPRNHRTDILQGYYVNGRDTSLEDFLDPDILDTLTLKTLEVLEKVKQVSPEKPVWLGETSSAFGGGAAGLSDTFVAGFIALLGLDLVMRQVFIGSGSYHLIDQNLDPLPDFWLSVLYKRLVGPEVLKVKFSGLARSKRVRLYLHCANTRSFSRGASGQPGEEGLISRSVKLNGKMLLMPDDETLPDLTGTRLPPAERLQIPGFSLGFFVLKEARAAACS